MQSIIPAIESKISQLHSLLIEAPVSSDLDKFVEESMKTAKRHPKLLEAVERDLDVHGLKKKCIRQADRYFIEARNAELEGLGFKLADELQACSCKLEEGRQRMSALIVFVFLLLADESSGLLLCLKRMLETDGYPFISGQGLGWVKTFRIR
jgi:hypothetical protein